MRAGFASELGPPRALLPNLALVLGSTVFLYLLLEPNGVELMPDSRYYIAGGIGLARGDGFMIRLYRAESDTVADERITAFPPGTSILHGALIRAGIEPSLAPSVLSVAFWALFLGGVGLLSARETGSSFLAGSAIVLATFSVPFLEVYTQALSEVVFLPLLAAVLWVFGPIPHRREIGARLAVGTVLLTLLVMTRYVGAFLYLAIGIWLSWWRFHQRRFGLAVKELGILALPAFPLVGWILWNLVSGGNALGAEIGPRDYTFLQAQTAILRHGRWLILPSIRGSHVDELVGYGFVLLYLFPVALIGYAVVRYPQETVGRRLAPPPTPLVLMGIAYLIPFAVWTLPFSNLMNTRFVVVLLFLVQLRAFVLVSKTPRRFGLAACSSYVASNAILFFLAYPASTNRPPEHALTLTSPRAGDLAHDHGDLVEFLERSRPEVILTTRRVRWMFHAYELGVPGSVEDWLLEGRCESAYDRVIVLLSSDRRSFDDEARRKCGLGLPVELERSRVFLFPGSRLAERTSPSNEAGSRRSH